jgi:hypothetical protein
MRTDKRKRSTRRSMERMVSARSDDFERYWKAWITTDGRDVGRWMAKHIGRLVGEVEQLKRRVARLER